MIDYTRFIADNFEIVPKEHLEPVSFIPNAAQSKYLDEMTLRDIILKPRQLGFSSIIEAVFTVDFLTRPNSRGVIISHESDATQRLLDKVKFFLESFARRRGRLFTLKYNSKSELVNADINSVLYVGTAGSRSFGRGDTIHNCHLSEFAFYPNPDEIFTGISQAVPASGRIIIESTANGAENALADRWWESKKEGAVFRGHFFPWFMEPSYSIRVSDGFVVLTDEQDEMNKYALTKAQVSWSRNKISELKSVDSFNQEYPSSDRVAFLSSGRSVFSNVVLDWYLNNTVQPANAVGNLVGFRPVAYDNNEKGFIKFFKWPEPDKQYIIGADVAEVADYSCAQVLDRVTLEQVAVWHGRCDADVFGRELYRLGTFYNGATVAVERNNQGLATLYTLRDLNYPFIWFREKVGRVAEEQTLELGWLTDAKTKDLLISDARELIRTKSLILNDEETIRELMAYVYVEQGSKGRWLAAAQAGKHDDRVMALMICIQMYYRVPLQTTDGNAIARSTEGENTPYKVTHGGQFSQANNEIARIGEGMEEYF